MKSRIGGECLPKDGIFLREISSREFYRKEILRLPAHVNLWLHPDVPTGSGYAPVYDCRRRVSGEILALSSGLELQSVYIGDKKSAGSSASCVGVRIWMDGGTCGFSRAASLERLADEFLPGGACGRTARIFR